MLCCAGRTQHIPCYTNIIISTQLRDLKIWLHQCARTRAHTVTVCLLFVATRRCAGTKCFVCPVCDVRFESLHSDRTGRSTLGMLSPVAGVRRKQHREPVDNAIELLKRIYTDSVFFFVCVVCLCGAERAFLLRPKLCKQRECIQTGCHHDQFYRKRSKYIQLIKNRKILRLRWLLRARAEEDGGGGSGGCRAHNYNWSVCV